MAQQRGSVDLNCNDCEIPVTAHQYFKARVPRASLVEHHTAAVQSNNWLARPLSTLLDVYSNITTTQSDDPWELQLLYGLRVFKPAGINSKAAYDCSVNPIVIRSDAAAAAAAAPAAVDCSILSALQKFGAFLFKVVVSRSRTAYKDTVAYNPDGFIQHKIDHQIPLSALLYGMATGEENPVDKEMVRNPITDYLNQQSNSSKSLARTYQSRSSCQEVHGSEQP
jgi:hypothetical protein